MTAPIPASEPLTAEPAWLDQRQFLVDDSQAQALLDLLNRPAQHNPGLQDLFSRRVPCAA